MKTTDKLTNRAFPDGYFAGFAWALHKSFATALSTCRFEQGDMLYDTPSAYGPWLGGVCPASYIIQITYPERGGAAISKTEDQASDALFRQNWGRTVMFKFTNIAHNTTDLISTTQGRLYSLLCDGDLSWIGNNQPTPPIPILASDIGKCLKCEQFMVSADKSFSLLNHSPGSIMMLMPHDLANALSHMKFTLVTAALSSHFTMRISHISPEMFWPFSSIPTVKVACFDISCSDVSKIKNVLSKALFKPTSKKSAFSVKQHSLYLQGAYML